ncbi:MAG: hypothetical protein IJI05_01200 [Erysipelotrichaceae bacterium]|nr:hypothetical protein [Erysipelotrichaceae bacterium]
MKTGAKLFLLLLLIAFVAAGVFALTAYWYQIPVPVERNILLYGGGGMLLLGLLDAAVVAFARNPRSRMPKYTVEEPAKVEKAPEEKVQTELPEYPIESGDEEPDVTDTIPTVSEEEEELEQTAVQETVVEENETQEMESENKVAESVPEDLTMVMSAAEAEKAAREFREQSLAASVQQQTMEISPQLQKEEPQDVNTWPLSDRPDGELSATQQNYISRSKASYIGESGKPQFHITNEMPKMSLSEDDDDMVDNYDDERYSTASDRLGDFLNGLMTVLSVVLALLLIFVAYNKFFG